MPVELDPDAALMLRVKRGDRSAFARLVEKYKQPVMNFVFRSLRDEIEAEDLAQNVCLQVYKSRARYERTAKFSTWLFTIARNLSLNEIRRRSRHPAESLEETHAEHDDQPQRQYEDKKVFLPTENVLHGELAKKIEEALAELPEDHRAQGTAAVVDLGLGEVEGVLALDVPGGYVVGEGEAEDGVAGAKHDREFGLGRGETGIGADADGLAGADAMAGRALEEDLRARFAVDVGVHAFAGAVLGIAEGGAGFVSAAAAPNLGRMDGNEGNADRKS